MLICMISNLVIFEVLNQDMKYEKCKNRDI